MAHEGKSTRLDLCGFGRIGGGEHRGRAIHLLLERSGREQLWVSLAGLRGDRYYIQE
jgi:hypothetical protein